MASQLLTALTLPVSSVRLEAYRPVGGSDLDMLVNYLWNIELSEALYPCLQTFEVALRNSIHTALSDHFQTELWFDQGILLEWQQARVQEAREALTQHQKPHEPGRIVAELSFGFWSSMFNSPYEVPLWHANGARLISTVFPHLPRTLRTRKKISQRVERIRRMRNRVFHYEPVWNKEDLASLHHQIDEALSWISPEMREVMALSDKFNSVFRNKAAINTKLETHIHNLQ